MRSVRVRRHSVALLLSVLMGFAAAPVAQATSGNVLWVAASGSVGGGTSCASPNYVGSTHVALQDAVAAAGAGDEIRVCSGLYDIGDTLIINKNITISGQSDPLPILDGGNSVRIMDITSAAANVEINRLHFRNGRVSGPHVRGGAIRLDLNSNLEVTDSHFINNRSDDHGGAIAQSGVWPTYGTGILTVSGSTFYRNRALDGGAIVVVFTRGASSVTNSTFVENTAGRNGGAISGSFADVTVFSSTFVDNTATEDGYATWSVHMTGSLIANSVPPSGSKGLCGTDDPRDRIANISTDTSCLSGVESAKTYSSIDLGFLAPWGGYTPTVTIGSSSTARDAVSSISCPSSDQRGTSRGGGVTCDAGAFEYQSGPPSVSTSDSVMLLKGFAVDQVLAITTVGLTAPIEYRFATEVNDEVVREMTISALGRVTGTPASTSTADWQVITATDAVGNEVSTKLTMDGLSCVTTQEGDVYLVDSITDLELFRLGICGSGADYLQTVDIDWDDDWESVFDRDNRFTGSYDGAGFSITGLTIKGILSGFIPITDGATIRDITLEVAVSGGDGSGGLVGYAYGSLIEDARISGTVETSVGPSDRCVGGVAGEIDQGSIVRRSSFEGSVSAPGKWYVGGAVGCAYGDSLLESSYFSGDVAAVGSIGGLVGYMDYSEVHDSYVIGTVTGTGSEIGGLVGWQTGDGTDVDDDYSIVNSYASVRVSGDTMVGAVVGHGNAATISSSFWEVGKSGTTELDPLGALRDGVGEQPLITATSLSDMKSFAFFNEASWQIVNGWENPATSTKTWGICGGSDRPYLLWEHTSSPCTSAGNTSSGGTEATSPSPRATTPTPNTQSPATQAPRTSVAGQPVGGAEIVVNGQRLSASLTWASDNTIRGTIGGVNIAFRFEEGLTSPDLRPVIVRGRSFRLSLRGLQPESDLSATIFSRPTKIGTFTVNGDGTIKKVVAVPSNRALGLHRLRVMMVDQEGRAITLWLGIHVRGTKALGSARVK